MNKARRKEIEAIADAAEELMARIEAVWLDERQYFDDMPENLQGSERGQAAEAAASALGDARTSVENAIEELNNSVET